MMKGRILIVDDDEYFRAAVRDLIKDLGVIDQAESVKSATALLHENHYDIIVVDMQMETETCGLEVLKVANQKKVPSIVLSSCTSDDITEQSYNLGCEHFLAKSGYKKDLKTYLKSILRRQSPCGLKYLTKDKSILRMLDKVRDINLRDHSIFLSGETGVGKSLVAKVIHSFHHESFDNFIHINCAELTENIIESELFGHVKGAFTGATKDKKGVLERANGGTLFLDEVATMSVSMQKKLLKAIEEKSFYPVGGDRLVRTSFTLITATCEDLFDKIAKGEFRKDLFFRLSGFNIDIPSLRDRKEDLPLLIKHFCKDLPRRIVLRKCAMTALEQHLWPGNIRELRKVIKLLSEERAGVIAEDQVRPLLEKFGFKNNSSVLTKDQQDLVLKLGLKKFINSIEIESVKAAMEKHNGKITSVIKDLGISNSAFYRIAENIKP